MAITDAKLMKTAQEANSGKVNFIWDYRNCFIQIRMNDPISFPPSAPQMGNRPHACAHTNTTLY